MKDVDSILPDIHAQRVLYQVFRQTAQISEGTSLADALTLIADLFAALRKDLQHVLKTDQLFYHSGSPQKYLVWIENQPKIISLDFRCGVALWTGLHYHEFTASLYVYFEPTTNASPESLPRV